MDITNSLRKDKPLTNVQINDYYEGNPNYLGCIFVRDLDNAPISPGKFVIINLGNEGNGGTHWVLLARGKKNIYFYFDSFGTGIGHDILNYIKSMNGSLEYNTEDAQDIKSNRCGFYCMYVADNLQLGRKFSSIVDDFSSDPSRENIDILMRHFS